MILWKYFVVPDGTIDFCDAIEHNNEKSLELQPGAKPFSQSALRLPPKLKVKNVMKN